MISTEKLLVTIIIQEIAVKVNSLNSLIKFIKVIFVCFGRAGCPPHVSFRGFCCVRITFYGAIAHSTFPGNSRIIEQVSAIGFGGLMCLCATISSIVLYL